MKLSLLIPAAILLLFPGLRTTYADTITFTVPVAEIGGHVFTPSGSARPSVVSLPMDGPGGLVVIDCRASSGDSLALWGIGDHTLIGDTGRCGLGNWAPFADVRACWSVAGNVATFVVADPADFNCSGAVSVQDLFEFVGAWMDSRPTADFDRDGAVGVQDVFDFLAAYFGG